MPHHFKGVGLHFKGVGIHFNGIPRHFKDHTLRFVLFAAAYVFYDRYAYCNSLSLEKIAWTSKELRVLHAQGA